jgi:hypothetical protein
MSEVLWFSQPVSREEAQRDPRVLGIWNRAAVAAEATERSGDRANAWLLYADTTPEQDERDDYLEHHGRRDRAYRKAGFDK